MKYNILILLSLLLVNLSCDNEEDPYINLSQNQTSFTINNIGNSQTISFDTNVSWTTKTSQSWCTVSPASGEAGTNSITVTVAPNELYDSRSCKLTILAGFVTKTFTINQDNNLGLIITQDRYELSNEAETIEVEVKANVDFGVTISEGWITQVKSRGLTGTILEFKVDKNESYNNREGSITIYEKNGNLSSTIRVFQSQEDAIILSEDEYNLSNDNHTLEVELKTNVDYDVIIPKGGDWVSYTPPTRGLRAETVVLTVSRNDTYDARSTEVYIRNVATNLQDTLTINQEANTGLVVGNDKYELGNEGGAIEVIVKTNVEFDVEISDDWITQVKTRGLTDTQLQFLVAENDTYGNREATITISEKNGELSSTIRVYQSQENAIIISDKTRDISKESQQVDVEVKTNLNFEIIIPEDIDWVSYTSTRGLRTETFTLNISENEGYDARTAEVYVKDKDTNLQDTLTINQAANTDLIIVGNDKFTLSNGAETIVVEVKTNVEFDVEISDDWITQVKTRGLTETQLQFFVAENDTYGNREGTIIISEKNGELSSTIKVYQSQNDAIIISEKLKKISNEKQDLKVELKTNVDNFKVVIPEDIQSWVSYIETRGLRSETVILNITENADYDERVAKVFVKDLATNLQDTLTIIQDAQKNLIVNPEEDKYIVSTGGSFDVEVKANVKFDVEISDDWITQVKTRGLTETQLQFFVAENDTYGNREGTITISEKDGEMSSTIKVYQSQNDAIIISKKVESISFKSQLIEVKLETNIDDFDVIIPEDAQSWVSYIETRGMRTETFTLGVSENNAHSVRSTEVYVKNKTNNLQDTLTINQKPDLVFVLSKNSFDLTLEGATVEFGVEANFEMDIEVIIPKDAQGWISLIETRALRESTVVLDVAENMDYVGRSAEIIVKDKNSNLQETVTITQAANIVFVVTSDEDQHVSSDGDIITVEVKTNLEYDVIISDDWISDITTRSLTSDELTFNIAKNDTYTNREGSVTIKQRGGELSSTIKVFQKQNDAIIISEKTAGVTYQSQLLEVKLGTNIINFDVIIPTGAQDWVSYIETRGLRIETVVLSIAKNEEYIARTTQVYIKDRESNLQDTLTINQEENFDFDFDLSLLCDGEWRATIVRGNRRWDLTDPVSELYNEPTYLKFEEDGSLRSEGAFGGGIGEYTTQGKVINTYVGERGESFEVTSLGASSATIMADASLFHLPKITSYWEVVEVTLTKNYDREIDFAHDLEKLYGRWRATSIHIRNKNGETLTNNPIDLTTPDMEGKIEPSYITFNKNSDLFIEGIFGKGNGRYTTEGETFYILTGKNEFGEFEMTELNDNTLTVEVDLDKVNFDFGEYQRTIDAWNVKNATFIFTKQADD